MTKSIAIATIARIEDQGDQMLLYPIQEPSRFGEFHIIASRGSAWDVKPGDKVKYEPYGFNFGWFEGKEKEKGEVR